MARILIASDSQNKFNIFVFIQMNLSFSNFFKNLWQGCVCHVESKSIQIFFWRYIGLDSISFLLNFGYYFFINIFSSIIVKSWLSTKYTMISFELLTQWEQVIIDAVRNSQISLEWIWSEMVDSLFLHIIFKILLDLCLKRALKFL